MMEQSKRRDIAQVNVTFVGLCEALCPGALSAFLHPKVDEGAHARAWARAREVNHTPKVNHTPPATATSSVKKAGGKAKRRRA